MQTIASKTKKLSSGAYPKEKVVDKVHAVRDEVVAFLQDGKVERAPDR